MYPFHSEPLEHRVLFVAGDLDLGFGTNGIARADFGTPDVQGIDVAAFGNRVYAAGIVPARFEEPGRIALAAFDASGRPDPTFGGDGTVVTDVSAYESLGGYGEMLVQPDG